MKRDINKLVDDAKIISDIIESTDTDLRGDLFFQIAENLKSKSQYYTGKLFEKIGHDYNNTYSKGGIIGWLNEPI